MINPSFHSQHNQYQYNFNQTHHQQQINPQQQQQQQQFQTQQQYRNDYESYQQQQHQQFQFQQQQQQLLQQQKQQRQKQERKRFLIELEFVQCLANPNYLYYLATQGYFKKDEFKNYLKYLLYWKRPEYIKFIKFPQCLFFLDLLQQEDLYDCIQDANCIKIILEQQYLCYKRKIIDDCKLNENDQIKESLKQNQLQQLNNQS